MKDLNLLQAALSLSKPAYGNDGFSPVLVDQLGRITNIKNVNHPHTAMMQIAENPNTHFPMDPALSFPTYNVGKINPNAKPIYEGQNYSIDNIDKLNQYYQEGKRRSKKPDMEVALQSDDFSILDGGKPRSLTSKDRKEIIASLPRRARQPKLPKLEYGSPFFDPSGNAYGGTWQLPILQGGKSHSGVMPHDILGMRTIGGGNYTGKYGNFSNIQFPSSEGYKEVGSIHPSEFRKLIRNVHKDKNKTKDGRVRIGESLYDLDHLKRLAGGMDDDIASEKLKFTQMAAEDTKAYDGEAAGPINIRGRGFEQYQAEPSFFDFMQAPEFEDTNPTEWTSMNDLFE